MYEDLAALFAQIPSPSEPLAEGYFSALPVPSLARHRVAKDAHGAPAILIAVADTSGDKRLAPIVLENLSVHHDVDCRITSPGGVAEEGTFTVVRCTGDDRTLQSYFLRVAAIMLQALGDSPSSLSVAQAVSRLAELFHAMRQPPRKSLQGLWAELFLIARAQDPIMLTEAWHTSPEELFDFSLGSQRIEVKSARGRVRKHHFALGQLQSPVGAQVMIASMFVEPVEAGISLTDLSEQIRHRLADRADLMLRVESVIGLTLGEGLRQATGDRFDTELAEKSLAFYDPKSIPKVNPDVPSGVSDVRFKSDLTGQQPVEAARMRGVAGIFRAALRQ